MVESWRSFVSSSRSFIDWMYFSNRLLLHSKKKKHSKASDTRRFCRIILCVNLYKRSSIEFVNVTIAYFSVIHYFLSLFIKINFNKSWKLSSKRRSVWNRIKWSVESTVDRIQWSVTKYSLSFYWTVNSFCSHKVGIADSWLLSILIP